jgi:hypothetical protein
MVGLFVVGLAAITMLMGVMKVILGLPVDRVLGFALVPFLLLLLLEGIFVRLLLSRKRGPGETGEAARLKGHATRELDAAQARPLPEPVGSVTEHTTRAFAPVYNERPLK